MPYPKPPKCQCSLQEIPFPWFSCHYVVSVSDQVSAKVDLITFLIAPELSPGTQTLEKAQLSDVSISLVCCRVAAQVRAAVIVSRCYGRPLFLEVCVYSGSGDPYKAERIDNRFARAGTCWPNKHRGLSHRKV